jgi:hypothetical protein
MQSSNLVGQVKTGSSRRELVQLRFAGTGQRPLLESPQSIFLKRRHSLWVFKITLTNFQRRFGMQSIAIFGFGRICRSVRRAAFKDNLFVPVSIIHIIISNDEKRAKQ